jgi:hypothetical protein
MSVILGNPGNSPRQHDAYENHVRRVRLISSAGITPPADWTAIRQRFEDFQKLDNPCAERLATAVVDGSADVPILRAMALAEFATRNQPVRGAVRDAVKASVTDALKKAYKPLADENYTAAAAHFDSLADKFAKLFATIDPDTAASELMAAPEKTRKAWAEAPDAAHAISRALSALQAAGELAGLKVADPDKPSRSGRLDGQLSLVVANPGDVDRTTLWAAWDAQQHGRTGRWGALVRAGATLRAATLDNYQWYPRPSVSIDRADELVAQGAV